MHHTGFHSTTAGLHFCYPANFCGCPLAHHLSDRFAVTRVLLKCIQQLLCSQHLSLVIVLGKAPLHIHRDKLANAHELALHNPFSVCEFYALLVLSVGGQKKPEMPPHSTTHCTLVGLTARPFRQASSPRGLHAAPRPPGLNVSRRDSYLVFFRVLQPARASSTAVRFTFVSLRAAA